MAFNGKSYAPPDVYTKTLFENPVSGTVEGFKIPVFIGEGNEHLYQNDLEIVRGSSQIIDQEIVGEDETGRAVISINQAGVVTLGAFDGVSDKLQVHKYPITDGQGNGTVTNSKSDVVVTVNGSVMVVRQVTGLTGVIQLAQAPKAGDDVQVTYFFKRTDTLTTDDVSDQVNADPAYIHSEFGISDIDSPVGQDAGTFAVLDLHDDITNASGQVIVAANNVLSLTVDGVNYSITIPPRTDYTIAQVAAAITSANKGTLTASAFINNQGLSAVLLSADGSIVVNAGSANAPLGLVTGAASNRTVTFYTYQGPIVDGSNGGVTTTDPSKVTVKVNGTQVIPVSVNGSTRSVTLSVAPKAGAKVTIQYWFNAWQDTFDYLQHNGITEISQCGVAPGSKSYTQGSDFILKNDKIVWGTAAVISSGVHTTGKTLFGESQISTTLIDNKTFLSVCTPVAQSSGGVSTDSKKDFLLPFQPTLGNGRSTPLGQSLFQTVSNGRIDLPTNRPDVVNVYWGYSVQDALDRGEVKVDKVEGSTVTLFDAVPVGASVYATFWYSLLTDSEYTLSCVNPGVSGIGTYSIKDKGDNTIYGATFNSSTKGSSLNGVTIEFPSGSELSPDIHFEGLSGDDFVGPTNEIVTVQFAAKVATPAKWTVKGSGPYEFIKDYSDKLRVKLHAYESVGATGLNLDNPSGSTVGNGHGGGYFASLLGSEVDYTGGASATIGQSYSLASAENFYLHVDDANVFVKTSGTKNNVDVSYFADVINEAASGQSGVSGASGAATIVLPHAASDVTSDVDDYYVGWKVVIGNHALGGATVGQVREITSYDGSTYTATVDSAWAGGAPVNNTPYHMYNPDARSTMVGATEFDGSVTITAGKHDKLKVGFVGNVSGPDGFEITISPGTYATPVLLATEIQTQIDAAIVVRVAAVPDLAGLAVECSANAASKLEFKLQLPGLDGGGFIQFLTATGSPTADFAILAGLDTATSIGSGQAALLQAPIARAYLCPTGTSTRKLYDRLILRNRLLPGGGPNSSMDASDIISQTKLEVMTSNTKAGLAAGAYGEANRTAVVRPATLTGEIGFSGGMDTNGEPLVKFYDGSGTLAANDTLKFVVDSYAVEVNFTSSASGTSTPLGPIGTDTTLLGQIKVALAALPGQPFGNAAAIISSHILRQEGAGFRLTGVDSSSNSRISLDDGNANGVLGLTSGTTVLRSKVSVRNLVSALMANRHSTFYSWILTLSASELSFSKDGLADVVKDSVGAEYLYVQDAPTTISALGSVSSVEFKDTTSNLDTALAYNTGLDTLDGDGASGEAALDGFFVKSNKSDGSGTIDESLLNPSGDGTGQDGIVGQTYRDEVTGLTFTILPRGWSSNPNGPWLAYPTGSNATFGIVVSDVITTDANIPHNALNGTELIVANTVDVGVNDTAIVDTYKRGGQEPAIGDLYYASYTYKKQDFTTTFYTKMASIEAAYGDISIDSPLSLASDMSMLNGAVLLGLKQVPRESGEPYASLTSYRDAISELEGTLPGYINPDIITPLRGDSTDLYQYLKQSNELMSSMRYKSERTSIIGLSAGSLPEDCGKLAQDLSDTRMRVVYPDIAVVSITDALGNTTDELMDGPMLAAMLVGSVVSPNYDVATPWTGRRLVGVRQLGRVLDAVEQNLLATKGVTVLEDKPPFIRVRHGLTTDMTNTLTKLPTIVMIADEVQRQSRQLLENYIGVKFLPGILSQVEGRMAMMMKQMVAARIITAYTGIKSNVSADDPTYAELQAYYSPVFPLLYLMLTFHLRSSL